MQYQKHTSPQEERFNALYAECHVGIRKRIIFMMKAGNYEMVDDLEQDTWLRVWRYLTPEREVTFLWVSTIATNICIDALRKKWHLRQGDSGGSVPPLSLEEHFDSYTCIESQAPAIDDLLIMREEIAAGLALIHGTEQREMAVLFAAGYSYEELMERFDWSFYKVAYVVGCLHARAREAALAS